MTPPRAPVRAAGGLGLCLLLGALGLACRSKDLTIDVSREGRAVLSTACRDYESACTQISDKDACNLDLSCQWSTTKSACVLQNKCRNSGTPAFRNDKPHAVEVLLLGQNPLALHGRSRCVPLAPTKDPACADTNPKRDSVACAAEAMNEAIARAVPEGLTYEGFADRSDAFPVVAVYQPASLPAACVGGLGKPGCAETELPCKPAELVACAGLAAPINRDSYDITCASCQNGLHFSVGSDTGPCPLAAGKCFLTACAAALSQESQEAKAGE